MSIFKNRLTGDVVTVYGVIHDHYLTRTDHELVTDDREGQTDPTPQPEVLDDEAPTDAPDETEPANAEPDVGDEPDTDEIDNPRSEK